MLSEKKMDLVHRSEIGYELQMQLFGLAKLKSGHNEPFIVHKTVLTFHVNEMETRFKLVEEGDPAYDDFLTLKGILKQMKTNNLYIE